MNELNHALKKNRNMTGFSNHFMADKEEYQRELYITLLSGIAQHIGLGERKTEFLHKLSVGINLAGYEKYLKKSQSINDEFFDEIIKNFKDNKACETLLTDALIMAGLDGNFNEKTSVFISKIFDLFETAGAKTREIVEKAKYALTRIKDDECDNYPVILDNIILGKIIADKEKKYGDDAVFLNCEVDFRDSGKLVFNGKNIKLINCRLLSPVIEFAGAENIEIKNCEITSKAGQELHLGFDECANVLIEKTNISQFRELLIRFNKVESLRIVDSEFERCRASFSIFSINKSNKVEITGNWFEGCRASGNSSYIFWINESNKVEIAENRFEGCRASGSSSYIFWIYDSNIITAWQNRFARCKSEHCIYLYYVKGGKIEKNEFEECEWKYDRYNRRYSSNVEIIK